MKTTMSLKQLRLDPREYIRLINSGYEVAITDHRKTLTRSVQAGRGRKPRAGDITELLEMLQELPKITVLDPTLDTVTAVKQARQKRLNESGDE